ncbi:MAG: hypothetical protein ACK4FA_00515 [Candidatus Paceibacteria bacterium]
MRLIKILIIALVFFGAIYPNLTKAEVINTGFVETNIWYSKEPLVEGEKVKVYTLVFNPSNKNFKGTVSFFDKTTLLGKKDFTVGASTAETISVDWLVTVGGHEIFAKITNPRFETGAGQYEEIYLAQDETERSVRTVSKKIPNVTEVKNKIDEALDSGLLPIQEAKESVSSAIPDTVKGPVNQVLNQVEYVRTNAFESIDSERVSTKARIDKLEKGSEVVPEKNEDDIDVLVKKEQESKSQILGSAKAPLQYVWLFFLTIAGIIFQYKVVFYIVLILALVGIVRLIIKILR